MIRLISFIFAGLLFAAEVQAEPNFSEEVVARFNRINDLASGAAVFSDGAQIGTVFRIEPIKEEKEEAENEEDGYLVTLRLTPDFRQLLKTGSVALAACPRTNAKSMANTVVELFIPSRSKTPLPNGAVIQGYSSYESFWASDFNLPQRRSKDAAKGGKGDHEEVE